jgi:hypothetical protein
MNCNYIPADDLAMVIYELVSKYLPNAIVNIESNGGYGSSVIAMLKKTSVKRNLYWEIKDRVVEEQFNGMRMEKVKRKMRVYCLYSTPSVRNRLIEILYERVMYHKDKFVAPILQQEMSGMVTKKNGKVEHSDKSHDDQVFSYLMALYVWYDGHNLAENFGIMKNSLLTDSDTELDEVSLEDNIESIERIDPETMTSYEEGSTMSDVLRFLDENSKFITSNQFKDETRRYENAKLTAEMGRDVVLRRAYCEAYGIQESMVMDNRVGVFTELPPIIFDMDEDADNYNEMFDPETGEIVENHSTLAGNLASWWDKV